MARWTTQEDEQLAAAALAGFTIKEAASKVGRSEAACSGRAAKVGICFNLQGVVALRNHLSSGGAIVRDDVGGVVGVQWRDARRNGEAFSPPACEAMLAAGRLRLQNGATSAYGLIR